jgi:uncharacterized protein with GYD domain
MFTITRTLPKLQHKERCAMPTYALLTNYTAEGIKQFKERNAGVQGYQRWQQLAESLGCEVKSAYITMGRFDGVAIIEAPDDTSMARLALAMGRSGVWSTETLRAFPAADISELAAGIP